MTLANSLLMIFVFAGVIIGSIILLVQANFITLKTSSNIKILYSSLVICLLLVVITFSAMQLSTDEGRKWLDSFSNSSDCEKPNRPYWCEL